MPDEQKRLSDDRSGLGEEFGHPTTPADRELGSSFVEGQRPGPDPADPSVSEQLRLGQSFADPNIADDLKLGRAFEESHASRHHRHRAVNQPRPRKPVNRRLLLLFIVALLVLFAIVFLAGFLPRHSRDRRNKERARRQGSDLPVVEATRVGYSEHPAGLVVPGTTTPLVEAYVYARANGYLARRFADIGDRVRKGQLLAIIDAPDLDQQVDQAREQVRQSEAQLAQQKTQLALAKITNDRWRVLVARGVFSRQDGDQREADYQAQVANVAAAERNVEAYRANLRRVIALQSYERVVAPFTGVVTQRNVDVGALISAQGNGQGGVTSSSPPSGGTASVGTTNNAGTTGNAPTTATPSTGGNNGGPLFAVAQIDRLRVLVSVPESYASAIRVRDGAEVHFQEQPITAYHGVVTRTSGSIDQNTRTLLTELQVANPRQLLLSGMYAVVTFNPPPGKGPLTISGDSIAVREGRNVVGVIRDGTVHLQPVDVGRDFGPVVEVLGGLKEGETIATTFTDDVREGGKVRMQMAKGEENGEPRKGPQPPSQSAPPGGPSQYGDQSITDQNMQGQLGQTGKKQGKNGAGAKPATKGESKQ